MPLSKNLYEVQDLAAFLLLSLEKPNIQLASSIVNELLLSLESELVHKILGFAWLLEQAEATGVYQYTNFAAHPVEYCGVHITDSPKYKETVEDGLKE